MTEPETIPLPIKLATIRGGITFHQCLMQCINVPELIENFDRLKGTNISRKEHPINLMIDEATGKLHADMEAFVEFCWECVFMRFGTKIEKPE